MPTRFDHFCIRTISDETGESDIFDATSVALLHYTPFAQNVFSESDRLTRSFCLRGKKYEVDVERYPEKIRNVYSGEGGGGWEYNPSQQNIFYLLFQIQ